MSGESVLRRYDVPEPEEEAPYEEEDEESSVYRAYDTGVQGGRREVALKIMLTPSKGMKPQYSHLVNVLWESEKSISLIYTDSVITLVGRNLLELANRIGDQKVRVVRCYHQDFYPEPAANDAVIDSVMLQTRDEATRSWRK